MVQLAQLRALRAVLNGGSFSAAGQQLSLTASAVSQQIGALEKSLGLQLFDRRAQGIRPLATAATLGLRADAVLAQVDSLEREAKVLAGGSLGVVRLGSFPSASARLLPDALSQLSHRRASIDVLLDEQEPDVLLHRLAEGSLDVALVYCYDMLPATWPPGVHRTPLLREALTIINAATATPLAADFSDADTAPWISSREDTAGWRGLQHMWHQAKVWPRVVYRSNDYYVVRGLVAAGLGAAVVPALAQVQDEQTCATAIDLAGASRTVYVTTRTDDHNPSVQSVARLFRQSARKLASEFLTAL